MKKRGVHLIAVIVALLLIGFALVVVLTSPPGEGPADARAAFQVARLLPADTVVYVRLGNLANVWQALDKSGLRKLLLEAVEDRGGALDRGLLRDVEGAARKARTLHLSFHGARFYRYDADVRLLAVVETEEPTPVDEFLPRGLRRELRKSGEHGGVELFELDVPNLFGHTTTEAALDVTGDRPAVATTPPMRAAPRPRVHGTRGARTGPRRGAGLPILFASTQSKVFAATDRDVLEDALDALANGREKSLADNEDLKKVLKDAGPADLMVYAAVPELLKTVEDACPDQSRMILRPLADMFGLDGVRCVGAAADYTGARAAVRLLMEPDGAVYEVLAQPPAAMSVPACLPDSAVAFVAMRVADGKQTWRKATRHVSDVIRRYSGPGPNYFDRKLRDAEREAGIDFDRAASLVQETGFFWDEYDDDAVVWFAKVSDRSRAEAMLTRLFEGIGRDRRESPRRYQRDGATVWTCGGVAGAVVNDCVFLGWGDRVERAAAACQRGDTLKTSERYTKAAESLPAETTALAYADLDALARGAARDSGLGFPRSLNDAAVVAALSVQDGLVELRAGLNKPMDLEALLVDGRRIMEDRYAAQQRRAQRSMSNLKQIAQAANLWMRKFGDNSRYPSSLKALHESGIIEEPKLFWCPGYSRSVGPGYFHSDYDSLLDRLRYEVPGSAVHASATPLAWERWSFSGDGTRRVVYFDGHVDTLRSDRAYRAFRLTVEREMRRLRRYGDKKKDDKEKVKGWYDKKE